MKLHNALKRGWLTHAVTRALGEGDSEGAVERFGETVTPVVNPWGMPEWAALRGEQLAGCRTFQNLVAAEYAAVALMNPAGSGMIVVVEAISFNAGATAQAQLEVVADSVISGTLLTVTNPSCSRDRRFKGISGLTRATFRQGSDAASTFGAQLETQGFTGSLFSQFVVGLPLILRPGDDCLVVLQTVNLAMTVCWAWRERLAYPGELGPA